MAELSIEQKAEAYDKALERAKILLKTIGNATLGNRVLKNEFENMFPSLKESEDENIRKSIISGMTALKEQGKKTFATIPINDCIAWLEKQGNLMGALQEAYKEIGKLVEENYHLKEEQKGKLVLTPEAYERVLKLSEKQSEQKSTDEVKPKFKVGDWVVDKNGTVQQILSYKDGIYKHTNGYSSKMFEDVWRLWDVTKDAKEGDVLFYDSTCGFTFIYDGINPEGALLYSYIESNDGSPLLKYNIGKPNVGIGYATDKHIYPATKKQRDLLFQKMKEAGYEWDAEKKELKKIEQKHFYELDNSYARVTFPFKAKVKSSGAIVTIHNGQISSDGKEWIEYQSGTEDRYKVYKPNNLELVCEIEQKPAFEKK